MHGPRDASVSNPRALRAPSCHVVSCRAMHYAMTGTRPTVLCDAVWCHAMTETAPCCACCVVPRCVCTSTRACLFHSTPTLPCAAPHSTYFSVRVCPQVLHSATYFSVTRAGERNGWWDRRGTPRGAPAWHAQHSFDFRDGAWRSWGLGCGIGAGVGVVVSLGLELG